MAPSYKLTYFDVRARGEISRLLFAAAKQKYEDNRIGFEDWGKLKPTTPFGGLPMLQVDGKAFGQGIAIAGFLAKEFGLYGKSNMDGLIIDQLQQIREDLLIEQAKTAFEKDEAKKAEGMKKLAEETIPKVFGYFENFLKDNKSGFVVGSKLSLGDIVIYEGTQTVFENMPAALDKFPLIKSLRSKVEAADGIKQYLAKRKKTDF